MKALAIAGSALRRLVRRRSTIFFILVLPLMIILLLGAAFGSSSLRVGIATAGSGALGEELARSLDAQPSVDVRRAGSRAALLDDVERGRVDAGVLVPAGYSDALRAGRAVAIGYVVRPATSTQDVRLAVAAALDAQSATFRAARFLVIRGHARDVGAALPAASAAAAATAGVTVRVVTAAGRAMPPPRTTFGGAASSELLLFIFITSLSGGAALIETRRLGVARRMLSTPTGAGTIVVGEALGRFAIALVQAALIVVGSRVLFGVSWGDPLAATLLVLLFCAVGAGAGLLLGSVLSSLQQADAISLLLGLGLAALGGSMVPLEVFSPTMRRIADITPHAWGNDAFTRLIDDGAGLREVAGDLAVLAGFAVVLLALGAWRLRRAIVA